EFIENDLLSSIDKLSEANNSSTYGRMNQWAAYALLTKLYINAEVWTGTPRWDDAITYADKIIESGEFSLESNYFANFLAHNEASNENIFVIPFDEYRTGNGWGSVNTTIFRSEEHTSELQSRENLVCRLLLEKKNEAAHRTLQKGC